MMRRWAILVVLATACAAAAGCTNPSPADLRDQAEAFERSAQRARSEAQRLEREQAAATATAAVLRLTASAPTSTPPPTATPWPTSTPAPTEIPAPVATPAPQVIVPTVIVVITVNAPAAPAPVVATPPGARAGSRTTVGDDMLVIVIGALVLIAAGIVAMRVLRPRTWIEPNDNSSSRSRR